MATIKFSGLDEYALKLDKMAGKTEEAAKKAIYAGAKVVADKISANIDALPDDSYRFLQPGAQFNGLPSKQKQDLKNSFGITPIERDENGDWNAKIGFDGYGSIPTKSYPKGLPNQLLARAVESGSSVRKKTPFVRPAVNATKAAAMAAMQKVIEKELEP